VKGGAELDAGRAERFRRRESSAEALLFAGLQRNDLDFRQERLAEWRKHRQPAEARRLRGELGTLLDKVRAEKMGELAAKFDSIHSIQRAVEVGSVSSIVAAAELRPYLIGAIERGMAKAEATNTEVITA
jgi:hypothetical protein